MPDMLVPLYRLPPSAPLVERLAAEDVVCRRAESYERTATLAFVQQRWPDWGDEVLAGWARTPPTVAVAVADGACLGFAAWNATRPNYFGPTGVDEAHRRRGIGTALLLLALEALAAEGYAYAIIGGVGPVEFYERTVGASVIPRSEAGIYEGRIAGESS